MKETILQGLKALQDLCYGNSAKAGWWTNPKTKEPIDPFDPNVFGTKIALIHSEVSEAMEGGRKNLMDDHLPHRNMTEVELADAVIRIFDLAGARGYDLAGAVIEKMEYNENRPDHKIENRLKEGGKAF